MSDAASTRRTIRSRSPWFWAYIAAVAVALFAMMFLVADRLTDPASDGSSFEPIENVDGQAEPDNVFLPQDRPISDCISAIQKPGCGSDARGGWRQGLVLAVIVAGLGLIAWRIVVGARRAKAATGTTTSTRPPAAPVNDTSPGESDG